MPPTPNRFPATGSSEEDLIDYKRRYFADKSTYRCRHMQRFSRNLYYDLGRQWIEPDTKIMLDGARGYAWADQQDADLEQQQPQPVTNIIAASIDVEFATLAKRQWEPKLVTFSRDPRAEAATKVKDDILRDRLKKLGWEDLRDNFIRDVITCGTSHLWSYWDDSYTDSTWVALPTLMACPACGTTVSSPIVPKDLRSLVSSGTPIEEHEDSEEVFLRGCPKCGGPLIGVADGLDQQQAELGRDVFDRPLGQRLPSSGGTQIELLTPFEYYPENGGIVDDPLRVRVHGICKIRSLDWIEERFPNAIDKLEPEPSKELFEQHPFLGNWDVVGRYHDLMDSGIYDNHSRVYTLYADPCARYPMGRILTIVGERANLVVEDGDLIQSTTDRFGVTLNCPKGIVASANWKNRKGEFWGKGLPDDLISPQNRLNGIDAQTIEGRERMGSPNLMVPEGANLQGPEMRAGYGNGRLFTYSPSPLNPNLTPEVFGAIEMPAGINVERENTLQDFTRLVGPADIEIGEAPRNITTTSGLQILGEQAERRRGTRERSITSAFKKVWKHQLDLLAVYQVEPDTYEHKSPDGIWELKQYNREVLDASNVVEVEKQAYIDRSIIEREKTREALLDGLYVIDSPIARKRILERMGLPDDVNEDSNLQIDHAKREWVDFVDTGKIPVIDTSLDDPTIKFNMFGIMLKQDDGLRMAEDAGWPMMLPFITGWEKDLMQMERLFAQVEALYGPSADPNDPATQAMYAQHTMLYQDQKAAYDAAIASGADLATLPPPPTPPIQPVAIPRTMNQKILMVWAKLLTPHMQEIEGALIAKQGKLTHPVAIQRKMQQFLAFRAVVESYKLMMPMPQMAAPGSGATMLPGDKGTPALQPQQPTPPAEGQQPGRPKRADMGGEGQ